MNTSKCRICLKDAKSTSNIFEKTKSESICTKLMSLTKLQIYPNDGFPNLICKSCNRRLDNCIKFIKLCEKSNRKLRNALYIKEDIDLRTESLETDSLNDEYDICASPITKNKETDQMVLVKTEHKLRNNLSDLNNSTKITDKRQCFTCGKIMSSSFRLKTHLATHSNERPYACQYCNKKFSLAQNLNVHLRIHTGEKPFHCKVCGKTFTQSSGLIAHKRKHTGQTPYKCVLCPRSFRTVGHLQYHTRRHTGEKNYECDSCSRAFITRSDLKQHLVTHSGEKLHVCSICGVRFSRASNLKRHSMYFHNEGKSVICTEHITKNNNKVDLIVIKK